MVLTKTATAGKYPEVMALNIISGSAYEQIENVPRLFVITRKSTFAYKGKSVNVKQVAEDLAVKCVLEGSVPKA